MKTHEQFAEDLVLYALGELDAPHCADFRSHLDSCPACRAEYQELVNDTALLALSVGGATPPSRSRDRLLAAIGNEPRWMRIIQSRPRGWSMAPAFAAVAAVLFAMLLMGQLYEYRGRIRELQEENAQLRVEKLRGEEIIATLNDKTALHKNLLLAHTAPQTQGHVIYVRQTGRLILIASNCQPLPANKVYQLWLLPKDNASPVPAGTFAPDEGGMATLVFPTLPSGLEAKAFAVTIEPTGGSSTPTMPIVMLGQ